MVILEGNYVVEIKVEIVIVVLDEILNVVFGDDLFVVC